MGYLRASRSRHANPGATGRSVRRTTDFRAAFPKRQTTSASRVSVGAAHTKPARVSHRRVSFELVRQPFNSIGTAFENDFAAVLRHHAKQAITVYDAKCFESLVNIRQHGWRSTQRFKCAED